MLLKVNLQFDFDPVFISKEYIHLIKFNLSVSTQVQSKFQSTEREPKLMQNHF
jgi:hypothetical protein